MGETKNKMLLIYFSIGSSREIFDNPSKPVNAIDDFKANTISPIKMTVLRIFPNQ